MGLIQLIDFLRNSKKVYVSDTQISDLSRTLGLSIAEDWKENNWKIGENNSIPVLTLARGGVIPSRYMMTVFETNGLSPKAAYITPSNYDLNDNRLDSPVLRQSLDENLESEYKKHLQEGHHILIVDELGDSGRPFYLTRIYLTSLISEKTYEELYAEFVKPLEHIKIGSEEETALLTKLRNEVKEYKTVEELTKLAVVHSKTDFRDQLLVKPDYVGKFMGNSWIVYEYEESKTFNKTRGLRFMSNLYHNINLVRNIVDKLTPEQENSH